MKKWFLLATLLAFTFSGASAEIETKIASDCGSFEPLISVSDPTEKSSHPAEPGYYDQNICIKGIEEAKIDTSCGKNTGFYLSSRHGDAHFSNLESYNLHVCTGQLKVPIKSSCSSNETALFSVSSKENAHVSEPGLFDLNACASFQTPQNISIEIQHGLDSNEEVFFDGSQLTGENTFTPPADFPYIVAESGGYTTGLVSTEFLKAERKTDPKRSLILTKEPRSGSIAIPLAEGDHNDIENRETILENNQFFNAIAPSFNYVIDTKPTVRVMLQRNDLKSSLDLSQGSYSIELRNIGDNEVKIS